MSAKKTPVRYETVIDVKFYDRVHGRLTKAEALKRVKTKHIELTVLSYDRTRKPPKKKK